MRSRRGIELYLDLSVLLWIAEDLWNSTKPERMMTEMSWNHWAAAVRLP